MVSANIVNQGIFEKRCFDHLVDLLCGRSDNLTYL